MVWGALGKSLFSWTECWRRGNGGNGELCIFVSRPWVYGVNPPFPSFHPVSPSYMFGSLDVVSIWNKLFDDEDRWIVMLWMMIFLSHLTIRVEFRGFPTLFMHIRTFIYQIKVYNGLSTVLFALFKLPTLCLGELAVWSDLTDWQLKIFYSLQLTRVTIAK